MELNDFASTATTLELEKEYDDLAEPVLLPLDWYEVEVFKAEVNKNKAWREANDEAGHELRAEDIDGAGNNFVLILKTVNCAPEFLGRTFFKYLPMPNPSDKDKFDMNGRPMVDTKLNNLYTWAQGFNAGISGSNITWKTKLKAKVFVHQEKDQSGILSNVLKFEEPMPISDINNLNDTGLI